MKKLFLAAGVAALAMTAPVSAKPDKGGGEGGGGKPAKAERGGGGKDRTNQRAERRMENRPERRAEQRQDRRAERRAEQRQERRDDRRAEQRQERRAEGRAKQSQERRAEGRAEQRQERRAERRAEQRQELRRAERRAERREERRVERLVERDRDFDSYRVYDRDRFEQRFAQRGLPLGFVGGCPPGLSTKNEFCLPPGQYDKVIGRALPAAYGSHLLPRELRDIYRDTDDYYWRYGDGYAYRVDRDDRLIASVIPLIGAGLGIGMPFPYSSQSYQVPAYYQPFYPDTSDDYYRYANGYVYEIDRDSGLIDDMIPLLDNGYGVGQMLPASYSYYNLPYQYRSHYRDDDDYYYRYAPGAIYQVDRNTQLITSIASLLTGNSGLAIGQPLPRGYDAYNVPYAYRDRYYDRDDAWYRYNDGQIYQVDPTTRLITAIVQAIV